VPTINSVAVEKLLDFGKLILPILTYFAGVNRTQKKFAKDARDSRINKVVDAYLSEAKNHTSFHGLMRAGVCSLTSSLEIGELLKRLKLRCHDLNIVANLSGLDPYFFFQTACERGYNFITKGDVQELVGELKRTDGKGEKQPL
jgi:hypothetical protein